MGRVADFIDIGIRDLRWPVFNIADSAVVIGMGLLLVTLFLSDRKKVATEETV
jgi:signal peptidase II